jgi:Flp pilus assembly protein TadB
MHIPICPDYRDEWDLYTADDVRSPYPPVSASLIRIRRLAQEELRRQEAAQRAGERRTLRWLIGVLAFCGVVTVIGVIVSVVHP